MAVLFLGFDHGFFHRFTIVAMEAVALYHRGSQFLAPEYMLETFFDRRRTSAGRTGNGDDRVFL
jgi:hypothetical protein